MRPTVERSQGRRPRPRDRARRSRASWARRAWASVEPGDPRVIL